MKFVYVLEDDPKFQKEICEAIYSIDPKIQIRLFPQLQSFVNWIRHMMTTGPAAISQGGEIPGFVPQETVPENDSHQLVMVVSKVEFLGVQQLGLMRKTRTLFIDRKICTAEDPTAFVLTAFDNPNFKIKELEDRILNNVICKPFDRLILTQHLTFAIDGRHPPSKYTVANQKTTAVVEMLKDVEMESLSDIGFTSKSYRPIPVGAISKYYGDPFMSERQRSLFAVCQKCIEHPETPEAFQASFTLFAADQTQISSLRKKTRNKDAKPVSFEMPMAKEPSDLNVILLDPEENDPTGIVGYIQRTFSNVEINAYPSFGTFMSELDPSSSLDQRDPGLKPLGGANMITLQFDPTGYTYLGFESDKTDLDHLFGVSLKELTQKPNWFAHLIPQEHRESYRKYIQTGRLNFPEINLIPVNVKDNTFLVKAIDLKKDDHKFQITLADPSREEQVEWLLKHSKINKPVDLIIADHSHFGEGAPERWNFVKETLKRRFNNDVRIMMTTKKDFTDAQERSFGTYIQDIFFKPVDRVYFLQKLKYFFPQLKETGDKVDIKSIERKNIIKAVNPVTVKELSEAGVVMQYYRPITLGSFRELVLWQPYEIGSPELLATCNFVEPSQTDKGIFNCHFVFFGIGDNFLKHIRIWIRDNYVLSKEGQSG